MVTLTLSLTFQVAMPSAWASVSRPWWGAAQVKTGKGWALMKKPWRNYGENITLVNSETFFHFLTMKMYFGGSFTLLYSSLSWDKLQKMVGQTKSYYNIFHGHSKIGSYHHNDIIWHNAEGDRMCAQPHTINLYRHWVATSAAALSARILVDLYQQKNMLSPNCESNCTSKMP